MSKAQHMKILEVLAMQSQEGIKWFLPQDFMRDELGDLFVGYEASARLSELARAYPHLIETKQDGKYKARRLRTENIRPYFDSLPWYYQDIFTKYGYY